MNHLLILLSTILIVGLSAPAYAQTISDHIVINEVDTNPYGDDSESISEWVELFNPTDSDVDISGWQIASTTVLKKTLTVPDGIVISAGDYLTFVHEKIWFTDTAESVELKNSDGLLIDKTREIYDLDNDSKTWQRTFDGYSTWKFVSGTAGSSNGQLISDETSHDVIVTVSSNKSSYVFDDTAIIGGTVSKKLFVEKPTFQTEPIKINISGPNFYQSVSLYPDSYLNYETTLDLVQVLGIGEGTYTVSVSYGGVVSTTEFVVGFEVVGESEQIETSFSVESEKSEYVPGELVSISGFTSKIVPFESVKFSIIDSIGTPISSGNLFPSDGKFSTSVFLTTVNPNYGVYTIDIEYDSQIQIITFNVVENLTDDSLFDSPVSDSMIFNLDQSEYLLNDYMTLSGEISNFDSDGDIYYQVVYFNFKDSDGRVPTMTSAIMDKVDGAQQIEFDLTAIPDEFGKFSIVSRIPQVAFSEGDYTVKANYGGIIEIENFAIVNEKSESNEISNVEFNVKTVIEKVNRISDNLVSITTSEKIIDEELVKPRVLSGSMITMSKDNISDVNLRVLSNSGICVIGPEVDCLVSESTRKPGQIFDVVNVDGQSLNVRYTGPDVRLEKFSILPVSSEEFLADTDWNVEIIKDNEISRFYYKLTYKTSQ